MRSRPDARGFRAAVDRTTARIAAGELFEVNICRRIEIEESLDPWLLYQRLRAASPAEYGAYLEQPDWAVLSVSPELFLRIRGDAAETRPIKGTRARRADPQADAQGLSDLRASEKDAAELAMIVDLARNDLGRVCVPGSVAVRAHRAVMSLATVHHTYSVVAGRLLAGTSSARVLRAAFPPGSITGAPKIHAMRVACLEEPCRRGVAMGSIGWIDPGGDLELSVAIRTAAVASGRAVYHAGCGIVADSVATDEYDESVAKARPFHVAVGDV
jgi:para-aminobenzoate synthetase component 1